VIFDFDRGTAVVTQMRRPDISLRRQPSASGFRFNNANYELTGSSLGEIQWKIGTGAPMACPAGS